MGDFELVLNTAIAYYFKISIGIRFLDTTLPSCAVEHSNHYTFEMRYLKRWYTACQ